MARRKTLTEQQVELLRWIADGSPSGVMEETPTGSDQGRGDDPPRYLAP
jgi:hypothetical protein